MTTPEPKKLAADMAWVQHNLGPADPIAGIQVPDHDPALARTAPSPVALAKRRRSTALVVTSIAAAIVLVVGIVAANVGTGGKHTVTSVPPGPAAVLAAYTTTVAAQSAHVSLSIAAGPTTITADGVADMGKGTADVTMTLPAPLGAVEAISTGDKFYLKVPSFFAGVLGKPWVAADRATLENLAGRQLGASGLGTALNVTGVIGWLQGVTGDITNVGTETIHGTSTTHYHASIDLTKVAAQAPAGTQAGINQFAQAAGQKVPVDVWIDGQGRLRQLQVAVDLSKVNLPSGVTAPPGLTGPAVATVDLWDFGTAVNATPPPAADVTDVGALMAVFGHKG